MTLDRFLDDIYVPLRLRGRSDNSVRLLRHAIRQFSLHLGRPATLDDLDDLVVSRFLAARAPTLSPHSVARERSGILALWNLAQARGLVRLRPCVQPEVLPDRTPRAFTADELRRLVASARESRGWIGPIPAAVFWEAVIAVGFETGERISAILSTPRDGWRSPWLVVPAAVRKGRRRERAYELSPEAAALVSKVSDHDGPTVFWWTASTTALYKRWHVITRRAGLGDGRDVQFHALRRSLASHAAAGPGGVEAASERLGHSSESITRRSYIDPRVAGAGRAKPWEALPRILDLGPQGPRAAG